ncbi:hypothetical protein LGZ99_03135 [Photorhabdus temperata]|uniref:Uncharacterized protein n=2 Tax=Photorhabdus temperata TaxID=574560 RepID=A0A081RT40_PHOTE|nr:hypothetical protein [Photorhabdus temperata]KER01843.1 hypothetical protein MEG1DRAFT_03555 [Photorhabdus temperata subsp. temperata Meg1]MCT8346227.1 hypothetical protein [Photorhabdus temperata]
MEEKLIDTKNRPAVNIIAGVTNIKTIYNKTPCVFVIEHGYIARKKITVDKMSEWRGDLWAPWIGDKYEPNKAIHIYTGRECKSEIDIWIFQDYWNPPNENAVKYSLNRAFSYDDALEIPGNNRGGGNKILTLEFNDNNIDLKMI